MATLTTACTLDCPDGCSLTVTVADGRIVDIDAAPDHPFTQGWICAKVKRHAERVYAPERVLTPLVRTGAKGSGEFRAASWDEALALVAERITTAVRTTGPEAVVAFTYNSSSGRIEGDSLTEALFAALGSTVVEPTICAATVGAAWDSVFPGMASADPAHIAAAKLIVVWGANPTVSNSHLAPLIQEAVRGGARLVVIDPRRTPMANRADLHLPVRPGTDVVLALALANHWANTGALAAEFIATHADGAAEFLAAASAWSLEAAAEVCGIDPDAIATLANWWADTTPTLLRIGWGQERNANGGAACRAILALPVLVGSFGEPGSGVLGSTHTDVVDTRRRWPSFAEAPRPSVNLHEVGQWLAPQSDHPCQVLVVQGANPVVMCPDQRAVLAAFERPDVFTVVHEQVLTDTARFADVVFPATTAFEIDDVITPYGSLTVQPVHAVIERVGESRSNDEFGLALAQQLGFEWSVPTGAAAVAAVVAAVVADPSSCMVPTPSLQFVDTEPRGGRAHLIDAHLGAPTYTAIESTYPLTLITPATSKLINSMFGEFQSPHPAVTVHPAEAAARGLDAGDDVTVFNDAGSLTVRLEVSDAVRPGVAVMAKGVWLRHHAEGRGVNLLTPASSDALANGACFNDTHVDIASVSTRFAASESAV